MTDRRRRDRRPRRDKDSFDEVADVARSAYRIASKIKDVINIETKSYLYGQSSVAPDPVPQTLNFNWNGSTPVIINDPDLGDHDFQRIGDSIKIHHLRFGYRLLRPQTMPEVSCRVIIYWDEGNQAASPSDILYSTMLGTVDGLLSPKDWDKRFETKILYDKVHKISADSYNATTQYGQDTSYHMVNLPIKKHTQFEAGSNVPVTGALKFFCVGELSTNITFDYVSMITYTDD